MATPTPQGPGPSGREGLTSTNQTAPHRPTEALLNTQSTTDMFAGGETSGKKKRTHRAGKKKKNRRQSFLPGAQDGNMEPSRSINDSNDRPSSSTARPPMYRLGQSGGRNLSETSLDSNALLDHRDHPPIRQRRDSRVLPNPFGRQSNHDLTIGHRPHTSRNTSHEAQSHRPRHARAHDSSGGESEGDDMGNTDRTPLLGSNHNGTSPSHRSAYGMFTVQGRRNSQQRRNSASTVSSRHHARATSQQPSHDVNNPPSVPNSPKIGPDMRYDDAMITNSFTPRPLEERRGTTANDHLINIDNDVGVAAFHHSSPPTPGNEPYDFDQRRHTIAVPAEEDVCFPVEGMSTIGEDYDIHQDQGANFTQGQRRRRYKQWPDLLVLDDWRREEKEQRSEGIRAKKISEPVLVGGRLRPQKHGWHRAEEDAPYRFTYFNEEFPSTIHSQTISELVQEGQDFRELFIPNPPELSDDSSDEEDVMSHQGTAQGTAREEPSGNIQSRAGTRHSSMMGGTKTQSPGRSGDATPLQFDGNAQKERPKRYGDRPTFWLDVLSPTDTEMKVLSKTFGIHPLTAEDILIQEAREKVELFKNYYFVNYRTFEQDMYSENFLEPVNMYVVVFREGVISFHFSMTPHPANVRRRIRQLKDYLILSSDWISYAIIDDITDVFGPLIQSIEEEVDDIDDAILKMHTANKDAPDNEKAKPAKNCECKSEAGEQVPSGGDMLRRVGEGRKKVMGLYRLLGNKADVIKGFAKRCNEHWDIAPRSEIGLYLGDIQDHILTMTSNLNHYETLLSRAHSNYLAQINIRMNERQEQTADVLGKLTVLGTIVLPMNIITGMWGMNVLVPGQDVDNLTWFWSITAGLLVFGVSCFFIAKRVYGIV